MITPAPEQSCHFLVAEGNQLYAVIDLTVYSETAVLRAAHKFTDRCHLHLEREAATRIGVRFRAKDGTVDCTRIAGDFFNEILDQRLREIVQKESEPVRNLILAQALSGTALIHPELDSAEPPRNVASVQLGPAAESSRS